MSASLPAQPPATDTGARWRLDLTSLDFAFDAAGLALLGTSEGEEGGKTVSFQRFTTTFSGSGNAQNILQAIVRVARSGDGAAETLRYRLKRLDGEEFDADFTIAGEYDAQQQMVGAAGTLLPVPPPPAAAALALEGVLAALALPAGLVARAERTAPWQWVAANAELRALAGWPAAGELPSWEASIAADVDLDTSAPWVGSAHWRPAPEGLEQPRGSALALHLTLHLGPLELGAGTWLVLARDSSADVHHQQALAAAERALGLLRPALGMGQLRLGPGRWQLDSAAEAWFGSAHESIEAWAREAGVSASQRSALLEALARAPHSPQHLELDLLDAQGHPRTLALALGPGAHTGEVEAWARDVSAERQLRQQADEARRRAEHLARALRAPAPRAAAELAAAVGELLSCTHVHILTARLGLWAVAASWPPAEAAETATLEQPSLHALWTRLAGAGQVVAAKYAALDAALEPLHMAHLAAAGSPSAALWPVGAGALGPAPALVLATHAGPARDWWPDELTAAELLITRLAWAQQQAQATQAAGEAAAEQQAATHAHTARVVALEQRQHALEAELAAARAQRQQLAQRSSLTRAAEHTTAALVGPRAALVASLQTLRTALERLWLAADGEGAPDQLPLDLPPEVVQATWAAGRADTGTDLASDALTQAAEQLTDAGVVEAEALAPLVVQWQLQQALAQQPARVAALLTDPEQRTRLQHLALVASSLAGLEATAEAMEGLLGGLLRSLSPLGSGRLPVDLADSWEHALAAYGALRTRGLRVEKSFELHTPVWGHPDQLLLLWQLLLAQAVGALPTEAESPREDRGRIRIRLWAEGGWAHVALSDSGSAPPGPLPEAPFAEGYVRHAGQGPLEWAWCQQVVAAHGGRLTLEYAEGECTARVALPLAAPDSGADESTAHAADGQVVGAQSEGGQAEGGRAEDGIPTEKEGAA